MFTHSYRISGLNVASQLELPGAIPTPGASDSAVVQVRFDKVPEALTAADESGPNWEIKDKKFLLRIPDVARILISGGEDIAVELEPNATVRDAAVFVLGSSFGILLHQRGTMVLHGSAVAKDGHAITICGTSGAGKSTLAAALCRSGCDFVADDVCVVTPNGAKPPFIVPDGRQLRLWQESITNLNVSQGVGPAVRENFEKYFVEPATNVSAPPILSAVYILMPVPSFATEKIESLPLPDALRILDYQAYRPGVRKKIGQLPQNFAQAAAVLSHVKVFTYSRQRNFDLFSGSVNRLLDHWNSLT